MDDPRIAKILETARTAYEPTNEDKSRVRKAIAASIVASAAVAASTTVTANTPIATTLISTIQTSTWLKGILGIGILTLSATGIFILSSPDTPQKEIPPAAIAISQTGDNSKPLLSETEQDKASKDLQSLSTEHPPTVDEKEPTENGQTPTEQGNASPTQADTDKKIKAKTAHPMSATKANVVKSNKQPKAHQVKKTTASETATENKLVTETDAPKDNPNNDNTILLEMILIQKANKALRANNPAGAMKHLREHETQFKNGAMRIEREGLKVVTLCKQGNLTKGKQAKARFLKRSPNSPVAIQVRNSCNE